MVWVWNGVSVRARLSVQTAVHVGECVQTATRCCVRANGCAHVGACVQTAVLTAVCVQTAVHTLVSACKWPCSQLCVCKRPCTRWCMRANSRAHSCVCANTVLVAVHVQIAVHTLMFTCKQPCTLCCVRANGRAHCCVRASTRRERAHGWARLCSCTCGRTGVHEEHVGVSAPERAPRAQVCERVGCALLALPLPSRCRPLPKISWGVGGALPTPSPCTHVPPVPRLGDTGTGGGSPGWHSGHGAPRGAGAGGGGAASVPPSRGGPGDTGVTLGCCWSVLSLPRPRGRCGTRGGDTGR